jgi:hypothetical protein
VVDNPPIARDSYHDHERGSWGTMGGPVGCRERPRSSGGRQEAKRRVIPLQALASDPLGLLLPDPSGLLLPDPSGLLLPDPSGLLLPDPSSLLLPDPLARSPNLAVFGCAAGRSLAA